MKRMKLKWKITILSAILIAILTSIGTVVSIKLTNSAVDTLSEVEVYPAELDIDEIEYLNQNRIMTAKRNYVIKSVSFLAVNIFIGCVIIYYIVNRSLKPIAEVSMKIKEINSNRLDRRLDENYSTDINDITIAFNGMAQQLEEAFLLKKQFAVNASHELRTPISSILTNIEVYEMLDRVPEEEIKQTLEVIKNNTIRIKDITKQLFELSSLEKVQMADTIDVSCLFEKIKKDIVSTQDMRKIDIISDSIEGKILGNYQLLYSAFFNIIQNAVKYNREEGNIFISGIMNNDKCIISIRDTGIGIAKEELPYIFEPFYRVNRSRSRKMGGSGLGLSIVREIVKRHGGEVRVTSKENEGTEISVILNINGG